MWKYLNEVYQGREETPGVQQQMNSRGGEGWEAYNIKERNVDGHIETVVAYKMSLNNKF